MNINDIVKINVPNYEYYPDITDVYYKNKRVWNNKIRVKVTFESDVTSGLYYEFRWGVGPASTGKDKSDTSDEYVYFKKGDSGSLAIDAYISDNLEISFESQWKGFEKWSTDHYISDYNYSKKPYKPLREKYVIQGPTKKEDFEVKIKIKKRA